MLEADALIGARLRRASTAAPTPTAVATPAMARTTRRRRRSRPGAAPPAVSAAENWAAVAKRSSGRGARARAIAWSTAAGMADSLVRVGPLIGG
jgi:hypothetical protein